MDMDTSASLAVAGSPKKDKSAKKRKREKAAARESSNGSSSVAGPSSIPDESAKKVSKKKQSTGVAEPSTSTSSFAEVHKPQKPSAKAKAGKGRHYTLTVALPGSILLNAQSRELRTYLAGQIARTCAIFAVDEIVVFHEPNHLSSQEGNHHGHTRGKYRQAVSEPGTGDESDMDATMARILEYLEMPQYLRKALIPMNPVLRLAGLLPPLDMHHHLRRTDEAPYREGVVVDPPPGHRPVFGQAEGSFVDVGLGEPTFVAGHADKGQRVTVGMTEEPHFVSATTPVEELGFAWGYNVREAASISKVLLNCPYEGGYDLSIGTSERGKDVSALASDLPDFKHALLVLGGLAGLELTIEADEALGLKAEEADAAFDHWINVCPNQGSRTIRTEEALMIALSRLKPSFERKGM